MCATAAGGGRFHTCRPHLTAKTRAGGALARSAKHIPTIPGTPPTQHPKLPASTTRTPPLTRAGHDASRSRAAKHPIAIPAASPPPQHAIMQTEVQLESLQLELHATAQV